jgi:DNA-binding NarL/FixJ family response regulator
LETDDQQQKTEIWIIEDNLLFRQCIAELINQTPDLQCTGEFLQCEDAIAAMQQRPSPQVLLLDIGLPGMSGLEGLTQLKEAVPAMHIIMVTVEDATDKVFQALCSGAIGYLLKTDPEKKIIEAIYDVLRGGSPINIHIARKVLSFFRAQGENEYKYGITSRELEILTLLIQGLTNREITEQLAVSYHTIDSHIRSIYTKLQVTNRSGAVAKALKEHLI